jgi:hypothetical protein
VKLSIDRLSAKERAIYLLGLAVNRQWEHGPHDPDTARELNAFFRWAEFWLTADELAVISQETGMLFKDDLANLLEPDARAGHLSRDDGSGDDVLF